MAMVPLGVFSVGLCRASAEEGSNGIGAGRHFGVELQLRGVCEVAALGTKGLPPTSAARCWAVSVGTCQVLLKCMFWEQTKSPANRVGLLLGQGMEWHLGVAAAC